MMNLITIKIYNSKGNEQKQFTKANINLAFGVLNRIEGKTGWWARAENRNGVFAILNYINGQWVKK